MKKLYIDNDNHIIVDGHSDLMIDVYRKRKMGEQNVLSKYHLKEYEQGNVRIVFLTIGGDDPVSNATPYDPLRGTLENLQYIYDEARGPIKVILSNNDMDEVLQSKEFKLGLVLNLEGLRPVEDSLELFKIFYKLGVRAFSLTWNRRNFMADGCGEERTKSKLTQLGLEVLEIAQRFGMIIDVSHISENSFWDIIENVKTPLIASHSNSRALCDHPRNLNDEQIRAIAEKRGVIGICFFPALIHKTDPGIEKLLSHIEYISEIAGMDHVGLGPDYIYYAEELILPTLQVSGINYGGLFKYPEEVDRPGKLPNLVYYLERRGFSDKEIRKILGLNFIRVLQHVLKY
jgi:membrane dipeptidase